MVGGFRGSGYFCNFGKQFGVDASSLKLAMEAMRTPWVDIHEAVHSIAGFAELQGIGQALKNMPAFDESVAAAIRVNLGDWRDRVRWANKILSQLDSGSAFYVRLRFNLGFVC